MVEIRIEEGCNNLVARLIVKMYSRVSPIFLYNRCNPAASLKRDKSFKTQARCVLR